MEFIEFGASKGGQVPSFSLPRLAPTLAITPYSLSVSLPGQAELGRQLAEMHKKGASTLGFGFFDDNTIGRCPPLSPADCRLLTAHSPSFVPPPASTPQPNLWEVEWIPFFRDHRLGFQLDLLRQRHMDADLFQKGQKVMGKLEAVLGGIPIAPCLLHGDLWSGNVGADGEGNPVILDPAAYCEHTHPHTDCERGLRRRAGVADGHAEAEFGMSWCAGFGASFYGAYFEV